MSKQIQAYFQTEDQAEGAKTSLLAFKTENLEVSKLENAITRDTNLLTPLVAISPSDNMNTIGTLGMSGAGGVVGNNIVPIVMDNDPQSDMTTDNFEGLNYVLVVKVEDENYDEIVQSLRRNNAHIEALSKM
ncbi:hypothetical protein ACP8HI_15270 [Paenibacillus sp. FA6]|uniref:hypothetical protein n=1 Tax=Paenibacillus sp. FA6 TaxID=3413029 RepID=UPI003F65DA5D